MWWVLPVIIASVIFVSVIIVLSIVFLSSYADDVAKTKYRRISLRSSDLAGEWGEEVANYYLRPLLRSDEYLFRNVLLPLENGHKTELDCVMITRRGLFCIETKRWTGHISGDEDDEYWIQKYDDHGRPSKLHNNPYKQNENHCDVLARFLDYRYNVDNVLLFVDLEDGSGIKSDHVFTPKQFKLYYEELDDELNINDIEAIKNRLSKCVASKEELEEHKKDIQRRFGDYN